MENKDEVETTNGRTFLNSRISGIWKVCFSHIRNREESKPGWAIRRVLEGVSGRTKLLGWNEGQHNRRGARGPRP